MKKKKLIKLIAILLLVVAIYCYKNPQIFSKSSVKGDFKSHFIDVGQGDSCFIEFPTGETMLIDCGESKYSDDVCAYISNLGYQTIDFVVATHGDADHIGGFENVFDNFVVESCYTTYYKSTTKTYERFCEAVENEGVEMQKAYKNDYIVDTDNFDVKVLGPDGNRDYENTNDASVVLLISYCDFDFLYTGDAPYQMLEDYDIGDIEVLKASHHGSRTGISRRLVNELEPEYTVISAGANNRYNHPHQETLKLLENSQIYCTSNCGNVVAICDGKNLEFEMNIQ